MALQYEMAVEYLCSLGAAETPYEIRRAASWVRHPADTLALDVSDEDLESGQLHRWDTSDSERLLGPEPSHPPQQLQPCTIYRVPTHIRACSPKAYDPKVVKMGIFHYTPLGADPTAATLKRGCARHLIARHLRHNPNVTQSLLMERCLQGMKRLVPPTRSCYSEGIFFMDDSCFAEMMFLEGCLILYLLLSQSENYRMDRDDVDHLMMKGKLWIWSLVKYDLLLLENQIPFFIVRKLFRLLGTPDDAQLSLVVLALKLFSNLYPRLSADEPWIDETKVHHLLHLFYLSLLPPGVQRDHDDPVVPPALEPEWIPCASELQENGVKFARNTKETCSFLDVTFRDGTVEIPPLHLCDYSEPLFRNLVAFEQCYPNTGTHITIYAKFMDWLLSSPADARLLQRKGILVNQMAANSNGSNFFGRICEQAHYASDANYLRSVFVEVNKCYQSRPRRWKVGLVRDHCNNPWMIVSIVAATVLLLLTFVQTFFTIYPYFHPRN